jgi:hypothetical protein
MGVLETKIKIILHQFSPSLPSSSGWRILRGSICRILPVSDLRLWTYSMDDNKAPNAAGSFLDF